MMMRTGLLGAAAILAFALLTACAEPQEAPRSGSNAGDNRPAVNQADPPAAQPGIAETAATETPAGEKAAAARRLDDALAAPAELDVVEAPLRVVVQDLARQTGVVITIDKEPLAEVGLSDEMAITFKVKGTLRTVLRTFLRDVDLHYYRDGEQLRVTTPDNRPLELRFFPVKELVAPYDGAEETGEASYDYDTLIDFFISFAAPSTWDRHPEIQGFRGVLLVKNRSDVLEEIEDLLAMLRKSRELWQKWNGHTRPPQLLGGRASIESPREAREGTQPITAALERMVDWDLEPLSLNDLAARIANEFGIACLVDRRELDDVGITGQSVIACHRGAAPLSIWLRETLRPHGMTIAVADGVLLLTAMDASYPETRVYPIFDLAEEFVLGGEHDDGLRRWMGDGIADLVEYGMGHGNVAAESFYNARALVVSADREKLERVERLLADLRKALPIAAKRTPEAIAAADARPTRAVYRQLADSDAEAAKFAREFAALVRERIAPDTWKDPRHWVLTVGGATIVNAPRGVQRQIRELHQQIQNSTAPGIGASGGMGMMGGGFFRVESSPAPR